VGPLLIVILGPTAIGKTSLSIKLAKHFGAEIISADSRQFYKEMAIGTAKPTEEEMDGVVHHFVDFLSIHSDYTAGQFETDVLNVLQVLFGKNKVAIMVGGSGLFVDAVCKGLDPVPRDLVIREKLNARLEKEGLDPIAEELIRLDYEVTQEIDMKNPMRVIRALEVCLASGKTYTSFRKKQPKQRPFEICKIGLNTEREILYDRINTRCDIMFERGWEEEARRLHAHKDLNALNTVGYKELFQYFEGLLNKEECVNLIKQHTRNFAKRQLTWFNKDKETNWLDPTDKDLYQQALRVISKND